MRIARTVEVMYEVMSLIATYMGAQHTQASTCAVLCCCALQGQEEWSCPWLASVHCIWIDMTKPGLAAMAEGLTGVERQCASTQTEKFASCRQQPRSPATYSSESGRSVN